LKREGIQEANVTEKPVRDQAHLRSPPARSESKETTTCSGLEAPCQQQGAYHVVEDAKPATRAEVTCDSDFETQEAMRNFQAYLDVLREWDEKEKLEEARVSEESTSRLIA
jgi:hypothetical protein